MGNPKPSIQVAAAVIEDQGRYLITQRGRQGDLPGFWEFPGGKREEHETLECCVLREVQEELGVSVVSPVLFKTLVYEYPDKVVELHFFRCVISHGAPRPLGCADWRWVLAEELTAYSFPPADEPVIVQLQRKSSSC